MVNSVVQLFSSFGIIHTLCLLQFLSAEYYLSSSIFPLIRVCTLCSRIHILILVLISHLPN